ncbi:hypothetical protein ACFSKY_00180 [Azotobacter chroococcum]|uniref:hypothetical protein n=1 Tax=Azotobacter chroococcum TaxID=353 RepID=UPI0010EC899D|nr:hypothetical protein E0E53_12245 [Azotobacter chroococcum]
MNQDCWYELTIHSLGLESGGKQAEISIFEDGIEIDRLAFRGRVSMEGPGYRKFYSGRPGLTAEAASGDFEFTFRPISHQRLGKMTDSPQHHA